MLGLSWKPFDRVEEHQIGSAIGDAEKRTSGEIRVHIDKWCKTDPMYKAQNRFRHLKMDQTEARNGVLIYVAVKDNKIAILGDKGINERVADDFWQSTMNTMLSKIGEGRLVAGICAGIEEAAKQLAVHFPPKDNDQNELSNEITYG